ncbi:hypothetical protein QOZ80_9AG0683540 [Eleusine coracana subsp. coracana]|nr:hypothetical protein QOZ80_9AG0683540 [Eleusine coracana subsp. coracana]
MELLVSSPPGAASPPSPPPGSTADPAATLPAASAAIPSPTASGSTSPLSPFAKPFRPAGRSNSLRWSDTSPASQSSGDSVSAGARSFRDVVASVSAAAPSQPLPRVADKPPPRIVVRSVVQVPPPGKRGPDADGWVRVESRSSRRQKADLARRPRRPVLVDLRGRCFNCFSGSHRAAQCKSRPRCFKCRELGHHSAACPQRGGGVLKRVSVWRRITPAAMLGDALDPPPVTEYPLDVAMATVASDVCRTDEGGAVPPRPVRRGCRRRRPRRRRHQGEDKQTHPDRALEGNGRDAAAAPPFTDAPPTQGPPCVINWSDRLARAEADLRLAVLVTAVGSGAGPAIDDLEAVKAVVASSFDLNRDMLVLRWSQVASVYILFAGDEATVSRLVHSGPTPGSGGLRLFYRLWTRQAFAEGAALPSLVDIEFRGIPAHAWEMSTAESLLNPYGWPYLLYPATRNREDYSVFRVSAWCFNPREVPQGRDLHVVEPPVGEILSPPGKPTLVYPVTITVSEILPAESSGRDSDAFDGGSADNRHHRQRRDSSPLFAGSQADEAAAAAASGREPDRDRLGPSVSGADGSSSQETALESPLFEDAAAVVMAAAHEKPAPSTEE